MREKQHIPVAVPHDIDTGFQSRVTREAEETKGLVCLSNLQTRGERLRVKNRLAETRNRTFMRSHAPSQVFQLACEETIYCDERAI
jgi:hypothetical protein